MHLRFVSAGFVTAALFLASANSAVSQDAATTDVMVVFDASGSMWGQVDGTAKIEVARSVFGQLSSEWSEKQQPVGLIAYGHRRKGDCSDIELLATPSVEAASVMAETVTNLVPRGKTPLSQAVRMAAEELKFTENAATVVLLSDGIETCDLDPCAVGQELERLGVDFTAHVIGFDIQTDADRAQLQCLAENTGGTYNDARDADALIDAFSRVTDKQPNDTGLLPVRLILRVAEGNSRPSEVTLRAANIETGEIVELGRLEGADQILTGLSLDLPAGQWLFSATGDAGQGEVEVTLTSSTEVVAIPFANSEGAFAVEGETTFYTDGTIDVVLRSLETLPSNATYLVHLLPSGAKSLDESLTFSYRFGSDKEMTEHSFYAWQMGLVPGTYDVAVIESGKTLEDALARSSIVLQEPVALFDISIQAQFPDGTVPSGAASWSFYPEGEADVMAPPMTMASTEFAGMPAGTYKVEVDVETIDGPVTAQDVITIGPDMTRFVIALEKPVVPVALAFLQAPLSPGISDAVQVTGAPSGSNLVFIGLDGQTSVQTAIRAEGYANVPNDIEEGAFRLHVITPDGSDTFLDTIEILPASAQDIGGHAGPEGEDPATMISDEEREANSAPQSLPFSPWRDCTGDRVCRISDPRVGLEVALPPNWVMSEPFYYTTAGGSQAENPSVEMGTMPGGAFLVALNPRQWDAQLGPCEAIPQGQLCREDSLIEKDIANYTIIRDSFFGKLPRPEGWKKLGRTWSMAETVLNRPVGVLSFEEPQERSDSVIGFFSLTNPPVLGLEQGVSGDFKLSLSWGNAPLITQMHGSFEIDGVNFRIRLTRPSGWDATTDIWEGMIENTSNQSTALIQIF